MSTPILVLMGSPRAGSYNRRLAEAAIKHAPEGIEVDVYLTPRRRALLHRRPRSPIAVPPSANALRSAVRSADALVLVTPKYNGTIPATLKNAIDWISRPYPSDAVVDKPVAVIGSCGGAAAAHVLMRTPAKRPASPERICSITSPCRCCTARHRLPTPLPHATTKSPPRSPPSWPLWPTRPIRLSPTEA